MSLLGEYGRALDILEDVVSRSSQGMLSWIETDSDLDPIRSDPRYDGMIGGARDRLALKADVQPA
jgi:adenylate cyclase